MIIAIEIQVGFTRKVNTKKKLNNSQRQKEIENMLNQTNH